MKKIAYVSVTFLYTLEPRDLNLNEDCTENEFRTVRAREEETIMFMPHYFNDIDITINP